MIALGFEKWLPALGVVIATAAPAAGQVRLPEDRINPPTQGEWDWGLLAPGVTYTLDITVVNRCKTTETIVITYWTKPAGLDPRLPESVTLQGGESRTVTAQISVPSDATGEIGGELFLHYYGNPSPPCLARTDGFGITGRILTPDVAVEQIDAAISMLRYEIEKAQVQLQAIKDSLFMGAREAAFVLDDIENLEARIGYLNAVAAQIEEKQLAATLNGIRTSLSGVRKIVETAAASGPAPETGSWYSDATGGLRRGRELANSASDQAAEGLTDQAATTAQAALDALEDARHDLDCGVQTGTIGPETATSIGRFISEAETDAGQILGGTRTREVGASIGGGKTFTRFNPPITFPVPDETDPRDEPPPVIYGEEIDSWVTDGGFQPTQAVWQDDDHFADKPGKRIRKLGRARWMAELPMVMNRPTLVFGLKDQFRRAIVIKGLATGSVYVPLKLRITLRQAGGERIVYEERKARHNVPLEGVEGPPVEWMATIDTTLGLPDGGGFEPFRFINPGPYQLVAELVRADGSSTGLTVTVDGTVVEIAPIRVKFVPLSLRQLPQSDVAALEESARLLGEKSARWIPRAFPLPRDGFLSTTAPMQVIPALPDSPLQQLVNTFFSTTDARRHRDATVAAVQDRFGAQCLLGDADRIVILMEHDTFATLWENPNDLPAAFAGHGRVVTLRAPASVGTVAHEIAHTMPYPWADEEMEDLFGFSYHNSNDKGVGAGFEIGPDVRHQNRHAIMAPAYEFKWISQGTYWNLIHQLGAAGGGADPGSTPSAAPTTAPPASDAVVVRGFAVRDGSRVGGLIAPAYDAPPEQPLTTSGETGWAVVQRNASGAELSRDSVAVVWNVPDAPRARDVVNFSAVVRRADDARRLELVGPGNTVVSQRAISATAPEIRVPTPPALPSPGGSIMLQWEGADADGDELLYTVQYSPDGGESWQSMAFEQRETVSAVTIVGRPRDARIRVIATDGSRSTTTEVPLRTP